MVSQSPNASTIGNYPNANIDPRQKGYDWIKQYCNAAYTDSRGYMPFGQLMTGNLKMAEQKMYALGKQPVDKYKKMFNPTDPNDPSWRAIDWTVPAFMCKYRNIAISKILQKKFDFQAYAIDPIAKSEEDAFFNKMKVKIMMRQQAEQAGSPLANSPVLQPQPGEPQDMEQLAMKQQYGYKHEMAEEAEKAIALIFEQNRSEELRRQLVTSMYDWGIGALTPWIDENGMVKMRAIDMEYFGSSYYEKPDGSDMVHWFEIVPTYIADLAPYYTKEQLDDIAKKVIGRWGNPSTYLPVSGFFNQSWNRFKVLVMKIKFLSYNETIYNDEVDKVGNARFRKSPFENKRFLSVNNSGELESEGDNTTSDYFESIQTTGEFGEATPKYMNSVRKVVYKASWVVDTDYMHDYGLQENQNRKLSSWWDTDLDIQIYGWNFYKMQFTGMTEQLIPFEDKACQIWFNLQNLSNKLIPYLINLEMNSIEGAFPYGKGGAKGKPSDVIDFIFSNFVVPYRASDLQSRNPNFKPVSIEATGQLAAFAQLHEELEYTLMKMQQVAGLNEATDASTVNAKNLNSTNEAMVESTNNALYLISEAEKDVLTRAADAVVQKVQIAVQLGKVEGYAKALGTNMVSFFQINPDISLHELGIFVSDAPTEAQREALWNDISIKESQGLLTIGDKYFIMTCRNLKEAVEILDYKIEQRKQQQQQYELQTIQTQAETTQQGQAQLEQLKQQTISVQSQADVTLANVQGQWNYITEAMKKSSDVKGETIQAEARTIGHKIQADAKVMSAQVAAGSHIIGKHMDAEAGKEIQHIANKKPSSAKK